MAGVARAAAATAAAAAPINANFILVSFGEFRGRYYEMGDRSPLRQ